MVEEEIEEEEMPNSERKGKKSIASRGIPASEAFYLPPYKSPELRRFQDENENPSHLTWNLEELVNFIFPKHYQEKYHEAALAFLTLLQARLSLSAPEITQFIKDNGLSKATFYNRVLPRLKRLGIIKVERDTVVAAESKRKYRPMTVSLSKTFGNYLSKIGNSWLALVEEAREKKLREKKMEKE